VGNLNTAKVDNDMATAGLERKAKQASSQKGSANMAHLNGHPPKRIYYFGRTKTEGKGHQKELLGGKGANLAEMTSIGLPVPPGFTITTEVCDLYYKSGRKLPAGLMEEVVKNIATLEKELGKKFGDAQDPLLVSVRSGAARSMPGMMNTILNLGLNDESVVGIANATGNHRFAYDAYRRLINMYGDVVCSVDLEQFLAAFDQIK
jgi:pyruvate,orthophosphate dikinase